MDYKNLVKDFVERTRKNLEYVQLSKSNDSSLDVYEVTQLINSLLGLLVFPQQRYFDSIPETPIEELVEMGWPVPKLIGDFPQVKDLKTLFRYLRNAISHFNIEFISDHTHVISGIRVWNIPPGGKINWKAELSLSDLELLTDRFTSLLLEEESAA